MYSEVTGTGKCATAFGSCPLYLVNYLNKGDDVKGEGLQNISGIYGYWTLSSNADYSFYASNVYYNCNVYNSHVNSSGVRPVITVSKSKLLKQ